MYRYGTTSYNPDKKVSGNFYWASHLLSKLGYKDLESFEAVLFKVARSLVILEIPFIQNLEACLNDNTGQWDYKLSRFACYLSVLYSDPKKEAIVTLRSRIMKKMAISIKDLSNIDRAGIREELSIATKWLIGLANKSGVENYSSFIDAGYQGLYGMPKWKLAHKRNLKRESNIQNWMSKTELALNLLRISLTEDMIRKKAVQGQMNLEQIHLEIGRELRNAYKNISKSYPEDIEVQQNLAVLRKRYRELYKQIN
jgi:DNA-damage-inducible protein D